MLLPVNAMALSLSGLRVASASPRRPSVASGGHDASFSVALGAEQASPSVRAAECPSATLLVVQSEAIGDAPGRRRRSKRDAAAAGLEGLRVLQRSLLGGGASSLAALEDAAAELQAVADAADDEGSALCQSISLRIHIEIAKRRRDS